MTNNLFCVVCGKKIPENAYSRAHFCSDECRTEYTNELVKEKKDWNRLRKGVDF